MISTGLASGLEIDRHRIESAVLGESREYLVQLPLSYDDPEAEPRSYPVFLLLDGEAYTPTLAGILHFMASKAVYTFHVPEMIIVGIPHPDRHGCHRSDWLLVDVGARWTRPTEKRPWFRSSP